MTQKMRIRLFSPGKSFIPRTLVKATLTRLVALLFLLAFIPPCNAATPRTIARLCHLPNAATRLAIKAELLRKYHRQFGRASTPGETLFCNELYYRYVLNAVDDPTRAVALFTALKYAARSNSTGWVYTISLNLAHYGTRGYFQLRVYAADMTLKDCPLIAQPAGETAFVQDLMNLAQNATVQNHPHFARSILDIALKAAMLANDLNMRNQVTHQLKDANKWILAYQRMEKARQVLKNSPHNAAANAAVGLFYYLLPTSKEQGAKSAPYLLRSDNADLRRLGTLEPMTYNDSSQLFSVANILWKLAPMQKLSLYADTMRNNAINDDTSGLYNLKTTAAKLLARGHFNAVEKLVANGRMVAPRYQQMNTYSLAFALPQLPLNLAAVQVELASLQNLHRRYLRAKKKLLKKPHNRSANLAVGRWVCFVENQWSNGLANLAAGGHAADASAARLDIAAPESPQKQIRLGSMWLNSARRFRGLPRKNLLAHAVYWYKKAISGLPSNQQARLRMRITAIEHAIGQL